eukprot:GEMP01091217.1.p1 GENE.GEMP01091217.1~~GEMP01091217.1.p1  ORF type:complete len:194 (+),score=33.51 GEMP01091217.1:122-703(+)
MVLGDILDHSVFKNELQAELRYLDVKELRQQIETLTDENQRVLMHVDSLSESLGATIKTILQAVTFMRNAYGSSRMVVPLLMQYEQCPGAHPNIYESHLVHMAVGKAKGFMRAHVPTPENAKDEGDVIPEGHRGALNILTNLLKQVNKAKKTIAFPAATTRDDGWPVSQQSMGFVSMAYVMMPVAAQKKTDFL